MDPWRGKQKPQNVASVSRGRGRGRGRGVYRHEQEQYQQQYQQKYQQSSSQYYVPEPPIRRQSYSLPVPHPPAMDPRHCGVHQTAEVELENFDPFAFRNPPPIIDDDDVELVPETQEAPFVVENAVQENMPKKKFANRADKKQWTPDEEVALAKAWVHISTCRQVDNDQGRDRFWGRILEHFTKELGGTTRFKDSLNTKWLTMNNACTTFNGCYIQADGLRRSGCDDLDVMTEALNDFKSKTGKDFKSVGAWKVLMNEEKWKETIQVGQAGSSHSEKRRKSSEGGNYESSSNDVDATVLPDLNEDSTPTRPRKGKGKKSVLGGASSRGDAFGVEAADYVSKKKQNMEEAHAKKQELLDAQLQHQREKTARSDFKFFKTSHADITDPKLLAWMLEQKRLIAARHGWEFEE